MSKAAKGRPKKNEEDVLKPCSLRLHPKLIAELNEVAEQTDRSLAQTMRRILESYLADYKQREFTDTDEEDKDPSNYILTPTHNQIQVSSV